MDLTGMLVTLHTDIKEWVQPALKELSAAMSVNKEAADAEIEALKAELEAARAEMRKGIDQLRVERKIVEGQLARIADEAASEKAATDAQIKALSTALEASNAKVAELGEGVSALSAETAEYEITEDQISELAEQVRSKIPPPIHEDAVQAMVKAAVAALPTPADGKDGRDGKDGADGQDGKDGIDGTNGQDGQDGRDGIDGKDALELEIRPSIDFAKSYPRGVFALHDGGLWRSYQATDGEHGWECITAGVASIDADLAEDKRTFTLSMRLSDKRVVTKTFTVPTMIYKQVYRDDGEYLAGDTVSRSGGTWHCNVDRPVSVPGAPKDKEEAKEWTLCAKQGRPGKDAT